MKKNIILLLVSFAMFMESIDTTVINTAIPVMAKSFNVNPIDLKIALISYLLSLAIFIPISGWVADKYGIKKVFIGAVAFFTLSSVWCGFTQSLPELIVTRVLQGLGGSLTLPVSRLIIMRTCERHELVSKMSIVVMIASLGMMLGPVVGGLITAHFSWRWIFWINAPMGLLTVLFAIKALPHMPPRAVSSLDKIGFILFGSGLATLTFGLATFSETGVTTIHSVTIVLIASILLLLYGWHSKSKPHPIVNVELLRIRTFRLSVIGNLLARLGFSGIPFLLPLLFQICFGYSPQLSGLLLAPVALGVFTVKPISLQILRFFGYKKLLLVNTILVGLSLWSFMLIDKNTSLIGIGLLTFFYGFLISLQYTGMNSLAYANVGDDHISAATSVMSTTQQLSQSFGVAVAAILIRFFADNTHHLGLTLQTFHQSFLMLGILTWGSGLIFILLKKEDGQELIAGPYVHGIQTSSKDRWISRT